MILIAVDPHKSSHTALAVDPAGRELGQLRVELVRTAGCCAGRGSGPSAAGPWRGPRGLGHGLSQWLLTEGESVVDVPARLLSDRRDELTQERTRVVNRLHRLLRELRPGGGPSRLSADRAQALLRRLRPTGAADRERLRMARELVREVRVLDRNLVANGRRLEAALRRTRPRPHAHPRRRRDPGGEDRGAAAERSVASPRARTTPATRRRRRLRCRAGRSNAIASAAVETAS